MAKNELRTNSGRQQILTEEEAAEIIRRAEIHRSNFEVVSIKWIKGTSSVVTGYVERHPGPGILVMDGLSAHKNFDVQTIFRNAGICPFIMPPKTARLLSPLDNALFAKMKFDLRGIDTSRERPRLL